MSDCIFVIQHHLLKHSCQKSSLKRLFLVLQLYVICRLITKLSESGEARLSPHKVNPLLITNSLVLLLSTMFSSSDVRDYSAMHRRRMCKVLMEECLFVQTRGPAFEAAVRSKEINNPKFSFLRIEDEHHHFYRYFTLLNP